MNKLQRRLVLLFLALVLILIYYWNNTFILNFFDGRFPFLIRRYYNSMIYDLNNPQFEFNDVQQSPRIVSLVFFLIVISGMHAVLIAIWFNSKRAGSVFLMQIILVSFLVIILYVLHSLFPEFQKFYITARIIKDYILSPIAIVLFILLWRIYATQNFQKGMKNHED